MKKIYLSFLAIVMVHMSFAQNLKPIANNVAHAISKNVDFRQTNLFSISNASFQIANQMESVVKNSTVLEFNSKEAQKIVSTRPDYLDFIVPTSTGKIIELSLFQSNIFTPDFSVVTSGNNSQPVSYSGGVHYWGIIKGDNNSLAAISIFNNEVMGIISTPQNGNIVLGKIENDANGLHILYNDQNLLAVQSFGCFTPNEDEPFKKHELNPPGIMTTNCIRLYWEVNFDLYTNKGSIVTTVNYTTGLFNQSAIIYANDSIPVELSEIYVWNTASPYTSTSTSGLLGQFQTYRTSMNGDLGHLLGIAGGGGVAAGFSGLCAVNGSSSKCYSGSLSTVNNVPVYSWSVEVVTHEQGHLMGSRHTHACVWNGNNTAIDNCGPTAGYGYEGGCTGAPTPVGGGTIMSYCHLVGGVGINFSNGFGLQPRTVIKNNFNNALCLTSCIGTACMPSVNMSTSTIATTTATFNWAPVSNAISYNIRYRIVGAPTWLTDTSSTTTYNAVGLTPGATYQWQVQTICSGGNSIFTISTTFITVPLSCLAPAGLTTTNISYSSATFNWTAASGATGYNIQYRIVGTSTWSTGTTTLTTFNVSGLTSVTNYEWQIQTVCSGGGTSAFSSSTLFATLIQPCSTPQNIYTTNITSTTASLNYGGLTGGGASYYNLRYRVVGAPAWINVTDTVSPYNAIGLSPLSNYEWQIQAICSQTTSAFSTSVLFTTLCATPAATINANGNTTFCAGGSVLLTANGGAFTYQWLLNGSPIPGMVSMNYPASASGNYTVVLTSGTCSATSAITVVTVNPLPSVTAANVTGCAGTPVALNGTPGGGTYSVPNPYSGPSTTYSYTVTDGNGCSNTASANITVNALPIVIAQNAGGCDGSQIILSGLPGGGSYSVANPYTGPSTTYTYTYTDNNGCSNTSSPATITINSLPVVTAADVAGCAGTAIALAGSPAGGSFSISDPYTGPSTTYTYSYTDGNGCSNTSALASVTVNALPTVTYNGLATTYTIISPAAILTGIPAGGVFSGPGISGNTFDPSLAGIGGPYNITYSYNDSNGCSNSSTQQTTVVNCPVPLQPGYINEVGGTTKVCPGNTRTYKITPVAGATSYLWTPPTGSVITTGQGTIQVTINYQAGFITSGILSVVAINSCGNSLAKTKTITINTPAKPSVISGPVAGLCNLSGVVYQVTSVSGITYNWTFNTGGATVAGGQGSPAITANYNPNFLTGILSVTAGNGCGVSAARTLTVNAKASVPGTITGPAGVCINQANVPYSIVPVFGAVSYTWNGPTGSRFSDGVTTSTTATYTTTSPSVTVKFATTAGNIKVKANNSCGSSSYKYLTVAFICRDGVSITNSPLNLEVYPNPASTILHVQFNGKANETYFIRLSDLVGKEIIRLSGHALEGENKTLLETTGFSKGIYMLEVKTGDEVKYKKVVLE